MYSWFKTHEKCLMAIWLVAFLLLVGVTRKSAAAAPGVHGRVIALDQQGMTVGAVSGAVIELKNQAGSMVATATSGEGGYYKIDLSPGQYTYKVTAPGYKDEDQGRGITLQLSEGYAVFNLTLTKGQNNPNRKPPEAPKVNIGELSGRVLEQTPQGELVGIPGAKISLRGPGDARMLMQVVTASEDTKTGEGGGQYRLALAAGTWRVGVSADGFQTLVVQEPIAVHSEKTVNRDFVLRRKVAETPKNQGVKVKVTFAKPPLESEELPAIRVYATPFGGAAELRDPLTQNDKQYFSRNLPSGMYQIGAMAEGYRTVRSAPTEVFPEKYTFVHLTLSRQTAPEPPPGLSTKQGIKGRVWIKHPNATPSLVSTVLSRTEVYILPADKASELKDPILLGGKPTFSRELPVGRYRVMAIAKQYKRASWDAIAVTAGKYTDVNLTLVSEDKPRPPGAMLLFEALVYELLPDGQGRQPLLGANVLIRRPGQSLTDAPRGTTDKNGKIEIQVAGPGKYTVLAQKSGYMPGGSRITITADGPNKQVITLTKKPGVIGPPDGKPVTVTGYVVYRNSTSPTGLFGLHKAKLRWLRQGDDIGQLHEVDTESAGRFSLRLTEGIYQVDVYPPPGDQKRFKGASEKVVVKKGMNPKYFFLESFGAASPPDQPEPPVANQIVVHGFVMTKTPQGTVAVPNAKLIWMQGAQHAMPAVTSDAQGQFTIRLESAVYEVAIKGPPGYNSDKDRVHVKPEMATQYFYLMRQPTSDKPGVAKLRARVLEAGVPRIPHPLQGAKVQILQNNRSFYYDYADPQGYVSFNLKPGSYEILTTHPEYESDRGMITLKAGATSYNIYLKRSGTPAQAMVTLNVQVGGTNPKGGNQVVLLSGARVDVMQNGRIQAKGSTNQNGVFTARLKQGAYQINVIHQSYLPGRDNVTLSGTSVDRRVLLKPALQMIPITQVTLNVQVGGTNPKGGNKVSLINGASVKITQNGRVRASGTTNRNGVFTAQLAPGDYQIQATHGSYYPGSANVKLSKGILDRRILLRPRTQIK